MIKRFLRDRSTGFTQENVKNAQKHLIEWLMSWARPIQCLKFMELLPLPSIPRFHLATPNFPTTIKIRMLNQMMRGYL